MNNLTRKTVKFVDGNDNDITSDVSGVDSLFFELGQTINNEVKTRDIKYSDGEYYIEIDESESLNVLSANIPSSGSEAAQNYETLSRDGMLIAEKYYWGVLGVDGRAVSVVDATVTVRLIYFPYLTVGDIEIADTYLVSREYWGKRGQEQELDLTDISYKDNIKITIKPIDADIEPEGYVYFRAVGESNNLTVLYLRSGNTNEYSHQMGTGDFCEVGIQRAKVNLQVNDGEFDFAGIDANLVVAARSNTSDNKHYLQVERDDNGRYFVDYYVSDEDIIFDSKVYIQFSNDFEDGTVEKTIYDTMSNYGVYVSTNPVYMIAEDLPYAIERGYDSHVEYYGEDISGFVVNLAIGTLSMKVPTYVDKDSIYVAKSKSRDTELDDISFTGNEYISLYIYDDTPRVTFTKAYILDAGFTIYYDYIEERLIVSNGVTVSVIVNFREIGIDGVYRQMIDPSNLSLNDYESFDTQCEGIFDFVIYQTAYDGRAVQYCDLRKFVVDDAEFSDFAITVHINYPIIVSMTVQRANIPSSIRRSFDSYGVYTSDNSAYYLSGLKDAVIQPENISVTTVESVDFDIVAYPEIPSTLDTDNVLSGENVNILRHGTNNEDTEYSYSARSNAFYAADNLSWNKNVIVGNIMDERLNYNDLITLTKASDESASIIVSLVNKSLTDTGYDVLFEKVE